MSDCDTLTQIEEYASLYLTVEEIALLTDLNPDDFRREVRQRTGERAKAYLRGKLSTKLSLRKQTKLFAEKGSPQAEAMMAEYEAQQEISEHG